jgi:glycylpeptide N-tetradecanoyltransferase
MPAGKITSCAVPQFPCKFHFLPSAFAMAKSEGFDVFNALDLMENIEIFETLKFGIGDGLLHYYLYNWSMSPFKPNELGLILL